jgi:alkyl sulfatase BDS1-like metallo-beta-lactamase superfamily hydrolase
MKGIQVNTRMTHCALVWIALLAAFSIAVACTQHAAPPMLVSEAASPKPASAATVAANAAVLRELPFQDKQDFQDAMRGFIAPLPNNGAITSDDGRAVWDLSRFQFAKDQPAPATVNPSLWRQLQLLSIGGLFEVTPRIYQVRGGDLSNITFIEGKTGIIVMDPCISVETAKAGLDLYHKHRGNRPVVAVVYTHSHIDHFGGVRGVLDEKDVKAGKVRIIAPEHFVEEAVSENVVAGNHMQRRASYMFGKLISPGPVGMLGAGLGLTTPNGMSTLIEPTDVITKTGQTLTIDGLTFEFLLAPGSEAPAEMHFYVPELRALTAAENANHTLHNLYTLRGAKVRDARGWASYLDQTIERWGDQAEVLYGPHHWPTWGQARIVDHLKKQRDMYKYLNDQTLRLANHGYNMVEAAEMINPPRELGQHWANRGTYGSVSHDVKAVWTYYLGYLDGNPARLEPLPPIDAGKKYVEYMGGASAVIQKARKDYEAGNYRWVAQVLDQVVSADPSNQEAKNLLADALEQMGYQAESGPWRNPRAANHGSGHHPLHADRDALRLPGRALERTEVGWPEHLHQPESSRFQAAVRLGPGERRTAHQQAGQAARRHPDHCPRFVERHHSRSGYAGGETGVGQREGRREQGAPRHSAFVARYLRVLVERLDAECAPGQEVAAQRWASRAMAVASVVRPGAICRT